MKPTATDDFLQRFIYRAIRKRAPMFAVAFAVLFTLIAVGQYMFVRHSVYRSAELHLQTLADQVAADIGYKDKWDLTAHRQSEDVQAPHVFVFTSDGIIVETTGFIPGLVGPVRLVDDSIFAEPKTLKVPETGGDLERVCHKAQRGRCRVRGLEPARHQCTR
jgi:hypothetical protein